MAMSADQIVALHDAHVFDSEGKDIGEVDQVFLDSDTNEPAWVTVGTGLFGIHQRFVPLAGAEITDTSVTVPYTSDLIAGAPLFSDAADGLDADDENPYTYYGLTGSGTGISEHPRPAN